MNVLSEDYGTTATVQCGRNFGSIHIVQTNDNKYKDEINILAALNLLQ